MRWMRWKNSRHLGLRIGNLTRTLSLWLKAANRRHRKRQDGRDRMPSKVPFRMGNNSMCVLQQQAEMSTNIIAVLAFSTFAIKSHRAPKHLTSLQGMLPTKTRV